MQMHGKSRGTKSRIGSAGTTLLLTVFAAIAPTRAPGAQDAPPAGRPATSSSGLKITKIAPAQGALGDTIELQVDGFEEWKRANGAPQKIAVFIDSMELKNQHIDAQDDRIRVHLSHSQESQEVWDDLLSRPTFGARSSSESAKPTVHRPPRLDLNF